MENERFISDTTQKECIQNEIHLIKDSEIKIPDNLCAPEGTSHHWKIDEPNGMTSEGCCLNCGKTKTFKNHLHDKDFISNSEHRMGAWDW